MAKDSVTITKENFDALLDWLDQDRENAGRKYEKIRRRLTWIFTCRGCHEAEELADETINRVTRKMPTLAASYEGEPALYFYGVADKIHHEWLRQQKKIVDAPLDGEIYLPKQPDAETRSECLDSCLKTLPPDQRRLIVEYYQEEKSAKIRHRKEMAERLGIKIDALQIKTHRMRAALKSCVKKCVSTRLS